MRRLIRERAQQCSAAQLKQWSEAVGQAVLSLPPLASARTVLAYHSMPREVDTHTLLEVLRESGHTVLLPHILGNGRLELRRYDGAASLQPSRHFHILEPVGEAFTHLQSIDLALVPGVAFTLSGQRLGRGGGYYDRLLPQLTAARCVGLAFPFQLVEQLPTEPHDVRLHQVLVPPST